jgi:biopolymer transport protein ExbD
MNPQATADLDEGNEAPRSARRSRRLRRHLRGPRSEELNIVSMIDVFAVLVFFLLVSSSIAAARLNILSLNLPSSHASSTQDHKPHVTVSIYRDALAVTDRSGATRRLRNTPAGYNVDGLSEILLKLKKSAPQDGNLVLLVHPDVAYEHVVRVMDAIRVAPMSARAQGAPRELYPLISIGETPEAGS